MIGTHRRLAALGLCLALGSFASLGPPLEVGSVRSLSVAP